jgi:hypothetical protein
VPRVSDPPPPVNRRTRRAPAERVRSQRPPPQPGVIAPRVDGRHQHPSTPSVSARQPTPVRGRGPVQDRGLGLLIIFTAGMLVMVALVTLTAIIGRWWILAPVMAVDFAVTGAMLAIMVRLLTE